MSSRRAAPPALNFMRTLAMPEEVEHWSLPAIVGRRKLEAARLDFRRRRAALQRPTSVCGKGKGAGKGAPGDPALFLGREDDPVDPRSKPDLCSRERPSKMACASLSRSRSTSRVRRAGPDGPRYAPWEAS